MGRVDEIFGWYLSKFLYEWNPLKTKRKRNFYRQMIKSNDLCFDVGAHLGDRVSSWLEIGASVVAFEPQPKFSKYLSKKFNSNQNFILEKVGLSNREGTMSFNICSRYPTLSSLSGSEWEEQLNENSNLSVKFDTIEEVNVSTLDEMIKKHGLPQFIKIDVESHEKEVLEGLSQMVNCLSFEFLSFNKKELAECLEICQALGYSQFNWSYQEEFKFRSPQWTTKNEVLKEIEKIDKKVFSGDVYVRA